MINGKGTSATRSSPTGAAHLPSYVIDASPTGVYPADFEELVQQARKRWIAVLTWRGMLSADKAAEV